MNRRRLLLAAPALVAPLVIPLAAPALAQPAWPADRVIRWLIGVPPAGSTDPLTRAIAAQLAERIGQRLVVENRPGGNQSIAARAMTQAPADGYTLLSIGGPQVYEDATVPVIGNGLDPVIRFVTQPMLVAGTTDRPTPDLAAVLAAAKARPGEWSYASSGIGSSQHVAGEWLWRRAGVPVTHVPYRGGGAAIQDAAAGHVPLIVLGLGPLLPHIQAGRLRAYAVTTAKRLAALPEVPTLQELGYPGFDLAQWHGAAIRAGTPAAITERLNREMREILATPDLVALIERLGCENGAGTAAEWGRFYTADMVRWAGLMRELDIRVE